jgi:GNAT superfamily N-acetyltransferase
LERQLRLPFFFDIESAALTFKSINLATHLEDTLKFRADSFLCSFGNTQTFDSSQYLTWLKELLLVDPQAGVHIWLGDELIGQMEFTQFKTDPKSGYVNLYYLKAEFRGRGLADQLDAYAEVYLRGKGYQRAFLSVTATNLRALSFYTRRGWINRGPREQAPDLILMEKNLQK